MHLHSHIQSRILSLSLLLYTLVASHSHNIVMIVVSISSDASLTLAKLAVLRTANGKKIKIIERVAPFWQSLGDQLNFDESGSKLALIEADHSTSEACCRAMFQHWLNGNGVTPCSWCTLIGLLDDLDQEVLAQEIEDAVSA